MPAACPVAALGMRVSLYAVLLRGDGPRPIVKKASTHHTAANDNIHNNRSAPVGPSGPRGWRIMVLAVRLACISMATGKLLPVFSYTHTMTTLKAGSQEKSWSGRITPASNGLYGLDVQKTTLK
jgi:hypothetical protein